MHILLVILLLLLLFVLVPLLFIGVVAYAKLRGLWYKLTGRPQPNPFNGFNTSFNTRSGSRQNAAQDQQQASQAGSSSNGKKIFSADEGEYVDFEVVD
ncbi:MAG: DUF4834 family protein [Prevotella sp.]|nr:DUF4834 family protein [Prevotella sp.]